MLIIVIMIYAKSSSPIQYVINELQPKYWNALFFSYRLSILKPASPMEKEKKKLNIEKPKTLKTSQNDKSFLKKRRKQLTLPGLGTVCLDLDHKEKFVEKKKKAK